VADRVRPASQLLAATLRPERARVAGLTGLLLASMLLPLAGPLIIGRVVDDAVDGRSAAHLTTLAAAYLAIALTAEVLRLALTWASVRLAWRAGNRLREQLADHALGHDLAWHGRHSPGVLISRIDGDIEALTEFFAKAVVEILGNAVLVGGIIVISLVIDWRVGLVLGLTAAATLAIIVRLRAVAVAANEDERETAAAIYGDIEERLGGIEDLRANAAGSYGVHRLLVNSSLAWRAMRRAWFRADGAYALASATFAVGAVGSLALSVGLHRAGVVTLGSVLALLRYSQLARQPLERLAEQLPELQKALAGASRAAAMLSDPPELTEPPADVAEHLPGGPLPVELRDVSLAYDGEQSALRDLQLQVEPGTTVGLVGRTGSGKTSIGRLLLRFWDPTAGTVLLGGVDVRRVTTTELRRRTAVVTQDVELLRASVRDNLTLFDTVVAGDDQLRRVLAEVGLESWLDGLADGLDTQIDPATGVGLSAGEAQLVAFARALLRHPGLVVLDEASSRLDPATEARITAVTDRLLSGRTAVVIAHRLATLDRVDQIIVLDGGRIVEVGDRVDLEADPGSRYARLRAAGAGALLAQEEPVL
jgi:ATP-binding cassette, subfamily B, bacterial